MPIQLGIKAIDRTGRRYGRLVANQPVERRGIKVMWECKCDCGSTVLVPASNLTSGNTTSCGCLRIETRPYHNRKHGASTSAEYRIWKHMLERCRSKTCKQFKFYGARGIEVRFSSFQEFFDHVGPRPDPTYSIERIDNDGHYEPGNVKWATRVEQMNNRRNVRKVRGFGEELSFPQWARRFAVNTSSLRYCVMHMGMSLEDAVVNLMRNKGEVGNGYQD